MHILNKFFEKIFILNLERCPDRKKNISEMLSNAGVSSFDFINAIDGKKVFELESDYKSFLEKNCYNCNNWNQSKSELGCWLSHVKAWQKIVDEDVSSCLILEDDVLINSSVQFSDYLNVLPQDWNVFVAGYCTMQVTESINDKIVKLNCPSCAHAYALKKESAKIFLDNHLPMMGALDSYTGHIFFTRENNKPSPSGFETRCNFSVEDMKLRNPKFNLEHLDNLISYAPNERFFTQGGSSYSTIR